MAPIRPLASEDHAVFCALVQSYFEEIAPGLAPPAPNRIARYWTTNDHHALTLHEDEKMIGFALIRALAKDGMEMSEFFVSPPWRNAGRGRRFANDVFARYPGQWRLGIAAGSPGARDFWLAALKDYRIKRGPPLTPHQSGSLHFIVSETKP